MIVGGDIANDTRVMTAALALRTAEGDLPPARARVQQLKMQMIFQDPYASLNPRMRVIDIVGEAPVAHGLIHRRQQTEFVGLQWNRVGLDPTLLRRFPPPLSAVKRARPRVARALPGAPGVPRARSTRTPDTTWRGPEYGGELNSELVNRKRIFP